MVSSEDKQTTIYVIAGISLAAGSAMILIYLAFKSLRSVYLRMIMYMVFGDMLNNCSFLVPNHSEALCYLQLSLSQLGSMFSILWTSVIAWSLREQIVKRRESIEIHQWKFMAAVLGTTMVFYVLPFTTDNYGQAQGWCWITASGSKLVMGTVFRLLCFYIPLIVCIAINTHFYVQIFKELTIKLAGYEEAEEATKVIRRLLYYPAVLIISYSVALVKRVYDFINPEEPNEGLTFSAEILMIVGGFLNFIIYGLNKGVRQAVCSCCNTTPDRTESTVDEVIERRLSLAPVSINYETIR